MLGALALAGLITLVILILVIHQLLKPSFQQVKLQSAQTPFSSIRGELDLSCYGKKSVSLMTLMAAAGMRP